MSSSVNKFTVQFKYIMLITILLLYAFDGLWDPYTNVVFAISGFLGLGLIAFCVISGKLWLHADIWLFLLFVLVSWFSASYSFGISLQFFLSRNFCIWMGCFSLYCVLKTTPNPFGLMKCAAIVYAAALSLMCLYIFIHASQSLLAQYPGRDSVRGCFQLGRLCGLANANHLGMACVSLIMVSVFGYLGFTSHIKLFFCCTGFIGWFCLGMTGFRTGYVGVAAAFGICFYLKIIRRLVNLRRSWSRYLIAGSIALTGSFLIILLFLLPMFLYKNVMTVLAGYLHDPILAGNIQTLTVRDLTAHISTMTDRVDIWRRCIIECFKNPRRALLGISSLSSDRIGNVYEGYHEITSAHAHNAYLEILRRFGLTGLIVWIILLLQWCRSLIHVLSDPSQKAAVRFVASSTVGMLIMGIAEPVPFAHASLCQLPALFYMYIGWCMNIRRNTEWEKDSIS